MMENTHRQGDEWTICPTHDSVVRCPLPSMNISFDCLSRKSLPVCLYAGPWLTTRPFPNYIPHGHHLETLYNGGASIYNLYVSLLGVHLYSIYDFYGTMGLGVLGAQNHRERTWPIFTPYYDLYSPIFIAMVWCQFDVINFIENQIFLQNILTQHIS